MNLITYTMMLPDEEIDETHILYIFLGIVVLSLFKSQTIL